MKDIPRGTHYYQRLGFTGQMIYLDKKTHKHLKDFAIKNHRSMHGLIRIILKNVFEKKVLEVMP